MAKSIRSALMALGLLALGTASEQAFARPGGARIRQGIQSGQITKPEAHRLRQERRELRTDYHKDRRDGGGMTPVERRDHRKDSRELSREIYKEKHDGQNGNPDPKPIAPPSAAE